MLLLVNLLGAIFAGVLAEGAAALTKSGAQGGDGDDGDAGDADSFDGQVVDEGAGDLLDEAFPGDGYSGAADGTDALWSETDGIVTDDLPVVPDAPRDFAGGPGDDLIDGGNAGDWLSGGDGNDQINARAGDDLILGGAGDDIIHAGEGDDHADGGTGNDTLHGGAGQDTLFGGDGHDWLAGEDGDDWLSGGDGDDTLLGGEGDDWLDGGAGNDWLAGGWGGDTLIGGAGADTLDGGAGNDVLWGLFPEGHDDGEVDFLNAGEGDDTLWLGTGDIGTGGAGADTFVLPSWMAEGGGATILDHVPGEDRILVLADPAVHADPQLAVEAGADDTTRIFLDGALLATVNGQVGLADIGLLQQAPDGPAG